MAVGIILGLAQGACVAYLRIPSFVVTLAGLLGFQGLMLKILGIHGAINMRDPFVRGITTTTFPSWIGWILAVLIIAAFLIVTIRRQIKRKSLGLETDSNSVIYGQFFYI